MSAHAIEVHEVSKRFRLYHERNQSLKIALMRGRRTRYEDFWALRDVDFVVEPGTTFGLVGHNGSGKSTLLKCMARILTPDSGRVSVNGKVSALLELGAGFHPELSGRDNVYLNGSILGLSKRELDQRFDDIVGFAGLEQFIDTPVKNYSSGMYVRLGFSVAINVDPEILLIDEVLAVGDEEFQRKCMDKFRQFQKEGRTIVVVSHAMGTMRSLCDRIAWLSHGELKAVGAPNEVVDDYVEAARSGSPVRPDGQGPTPPVVIESLHIDGAAEDETVRSGAPWTARIHYASSVAGTDPRFRVDVHTLGGVHVSRLSTADDSRVLAPAAGGVVEVDVDRLPLAAGAYNLTVTAIEGRTGQAVHAAGPVRFDVVGDGRGEDAGIIVMEPRWAYREVESAP